MDLDTHYKYDTDGRFYYLTVLGAEEYTGIDELDVVWKDAQRRLKSQGRILHEIMCLSNDEENRPRYRRRDIVEHAIYKNLNNELNDVLFMLGEFAEWSYDIDGDRMVYEERNPFDAVRLLPITIQSRARQSGLIFLGKTVYAVPEDEYQVGY